MVKEPKRMARNAMAYLAAIRLDAAQERGHVDIQLGELFVAYTVTMPTS